MQLFLLKDLYFQFHLVHKIHSSNFKKGNKNKSSFEVQDHFSMSSCCAEGRVHKLISSLRVESERLTSFVAEGQPLP